ncbi:dormancy-associated protein homolog 3-like isoform X1 [Lolium rigidum]|uniref:dormancy-associated protein homolog 3-like isoform X1 n=1 Tax=Lolium rigidum TaxID=89674 RepID=UPI001F5E1640|nr:dormancy-associated protein homolog 3-like isoform X1 [Lolium rigidum]
MGLLDQLWDDTVAGPRPDHGLGKLRKYASFSPSSTTAASGAAGSVAAAPAVTRSITILRPPALSVTSPRSESGSAPSSPASVPDSPFGGTATTPRGEGWSKFRRKGRMGADGTDVASSPGTPRSPTVYDWYVPLSSSYSGVPYLTGW